MCSHVWSWVSGQKDDKVFKVLKCQICHQIDDVVLKDLTQKESFPDKNQRYYDQMFKCFDVVTAKYPDMAEDNREAMAVSLFIKTGGYV